MEEVTFTGTVIRGEGEGGKMGYPTANLPSALIEEHRLQRGVWYATTTFSGKQYESLLVVGVPGQDGQAKLEAYLLDFSGDLYGVSLTVTVLKKLRDLVPFTNRETLRAQIEQDIAAAREYFKQKRPLLI